MEARGLRLVDRLLMPEARRPSDEVGRHDDT